jgi:hypothetical protein
MRNTVMNSEEMRISQPSTFERRMVIYNAVWDLAVENADFDARIACARIRQFLPDLTDNEFLCAIKAFMRVSSVLPARGELVDDVSPADLKCEVEAIIEAYASGDQHAGDGCRAALRPRCQLWEKRGWRPFEMT